MNRDADETIRRVELLKDAVRKAGIKLTHQRLEVFKEIAGRVDHPDAESVFQAVKDRVPTISLDTVYRTLWTLKELGLITSLGTSRESVRFDANLHRHHHFVCVKCGLIRDFDHPAYDSLPVPDEANRYGTILGTQIEVHGVCRSCGVTATGRVDPETNQ